MRSVVMIVLKTEVTQSIIDFVANGVIPSQAILSNVSRQGRFFILS